MPIAAASKPFLTAFLIRKYCMKLQSGDAQHSTVLTRSETDYEARADMACRPPVTGFLDNLAFQQLHLLRVR